MLNTERLLARVLGVPYAVSDTNRPVLTMWQMLTAQGRNPLDIEDFAIKAALAYDELVRMLKSGKADHLFVGMTADEDLWRTLIADAIHGDDDVYQPLLETANAFEHALAGWLRSLCPDAPALYDAAVVAAIRNAVIGVLVEHLPQPDGRREALAARARELAHVFASVANTPSEMPTPTEEQ